MEMLLLLATISPLTAGMTWEVFSRRGRQRGLPPWLQLALFVWMCIGFVLMPWLFD